MLKSVLNKFLGLPSFSIETREDSIVASHAPTFNLTQKKYGVFLSFRGDDTRNNFTSHLHNALCKKKIQVYIDEKQDTGFEISQALKEAIEGSRLAVVIFSANYADSSWCLNELVHIFKCKKLHEMLVVPVFYHVEPSDVRKQKGDFANALSRIKNLPSEAVLREWKGALTEAANLSGWDSANIRTEAELVEIIVGDVIRKLGGQPTVDFTRLIGFPERLKVAESMLEIGSPEVRIIGIGGMGGIGKTTLAKTMYRRISFQFDACCFLENVRDEWKYGRGGCYLQNKLMSELFPGENVQADNIYRIFDKSRLQLKKVLIVLDDVDDSRQLNVIAGGRDWYGPGSRIILTSRDDRALDGSDVRHRVAELSPDEAIELFQLEAFETSLTEDDIRRSREAVLNSRTRTDFHPLALISLASALRGRSFDRWRDILENIRNHPGGCVHNLLRQSYDTLGEQNQIIFLDIACFFNGESKDFAKRILDGCGYPADEGIEDLINKSLLNIVEFNKLWMLHLIEEMGREIVLAESKEEPGRRSRLWKPEDLCHVFEYNTQTDTIQGISLDMRGINEVAVSSTVFSNMYNLRVLKFHNHFGKCMLMFPRQEQELQSLPKKLRYLYWDGYPFPSFPTQFTGQYLVALKMQYSKVERLWDRAQDLKHLRVLDLSFSKLLIEIPNLSKATKVESVCLRGCERVREVPQYFEDLEQLNSLNLEDCASLETVSALPRNIVDVNLTRCVSLTSLPQNVPTLKRLERLQLAGCSSFEYNPEILALLQDFE